MKRFLVVSILFLSSVLYCDQSQFSFFQPPPDWLMSNPKDFKDGVKIGFVASKRKIFTPAITLTLEKIPCSEKTYIEIVKKNHKSDITKDVRELGLLQTKSGSAHLLQIDTKNTWGKVRILQAILVKEGVAYIQTASCLREDFLKIHRDLLDSFNSLSVSDDLVSSLKEKKDFEERMESLFRSWRKHLRTAKGEKEVLFKGSFFQKNQWGPFTEYITKNHSDCGICWQILAIQYVKEKLMDM